MKKPLPLMIALVAIAVTSCSNKIVERTARTYEPYSKPMMADLDVNPAKVTGTYVAHRSDYDFVMWAKHKMNIGQFKLNAVYDALKQGNHDVLVYPQFEIIKERSSVTVNVTGYPAQYKNFRPIPETVKVNPVELKKDTPYLIEEKDSDNNTTNYKVITYDYGIDINDVSLEKVVISKSKKKND